MQVWEDETLTVETDGKVTLSKTPVDAVSFENSEGESYLMETESTEGQLPTTFAKEGAKVKARYKIDAEGEIVEIKADTFSEAYEMEYHTLEYDPETETIHSDLYIQFDKISPSGEAELNFEAGNAITPEIKFTALAVDNSLGRFIRVKRKADGSKGEKPTESPKQSVDLGGASA